MDPKHAREILELLADGVDPATGEVLPPDSVCNRAEVVRALHCALNVLEKRVQRPLPANAGKPWSSEDDEHLCHMYDAGSAKQEMCDYFKRTAGSIESRLVRLGKIRNRQNF